MKTGILHYDVKLDKIGEFKMVWEGFLVALRREQRVESAFLFTNPDTGKCFSIGFYDTPEIAKAIPSTIAFQRFLSNIKDLVKAPPYREVCDVIGDLDQITSIKKAA